MRTRSIESKQFTRRLLAPLLLLLACGGAAAEGLASRYIFTALPSLLEDGWDLPYAANDLGQIVGTSGMPLQAARWQRGQAQALATPAGKTESSAAGLNRQGWTVGFAVGADFQDRPFLWKNDGLPIDIGTPAHGPPLMACLSCTHE